MEGAARGDENGVQSGRALRAKKLYNGQEPQAIFRAQPMAPPADGSAR